MTLLFSNLLWDTNFHVNKQKNEIFFKKDANAQQLYMQRNLGFKKEEKIGLYNLNNYSIMFRSSSLVLLELYSVCRVHTASFTCVCIYVCI